MEISPIRQRLRTLQSLGLFSLCQHVPSTLTYDRSPRNSFLLQADLSFDCHDGPPQQVSAFPQKYPVQCSVRPHLPAPPRVRRLFIHVRRQLPRCGDTCRVGLLRATRCPQHFGKLVVLDASPPSSVEYLRVGDDSGIFASDVPLTVFVGVGTTSTGPVTPTWSCYDK